MGKIARWLSPAWVALVGAGVPVAPPAHAATIGVGCGANRAIELINAVAAANATPAGIL